MCTALCSILLGIQQFQYHSKIDVSFADLSAPYQRGMRIRMG